MRTCVLARTLLVLALIGVLGACGTSGKRDARPASASSMPAEPDDATIVDEEPSPPPADVEPKRRLAATVPQGGRLRGLMAVDIDRWDGSDYYLEAWTVDFITCNTLVGYPTTADPDRSLDLRPELAAAMPDVSPDGQTYTFTLRKGVHFSDGRELTAADVRATFLRMLDPAATFQAAGTVYYDGIVGARSYRERMAPDISGITVDGDRVVFRLVRPSGSFLYALALPFACVVPADALHRQTDLPPPMTGPYMVTAHVPGRSLTIDRNPEWEANVAAGMPADPGTFNVDGFDIAMGVPQREQARRLARGEADFSFDQGCCQRSARALARDAATRGRLHVAPRLQITYVTINVHADPFDDVRVRRAANFAVDRAAMVAIAGGRLVAQPSSGVLPAPMLPRAVAGDPYPARPDRGRARRLLRAAGVTTPVFGGTIYYPKAPFSGPNARLAHQLARDLAAVGLVMQPRGRDVDDYFRFVQDPSNIDMLAFAGWEADFPDGSAVFPPLLSSAAARGGANYGDFAERTVDGAIARIDRLPPGAARRRAYARLSYQVAARHAPWITLYTSNGLNLVSKRYGGYHTSPAKGILLGLAYVKK